MAKPTSDIVKRTPALSKPESDIFKALVESSPRPMLVTNGKAEIQYVNVSWEKQFGYVLEEVKGKNPRMLQSGRTPPDVYKKMWKAISAGKPFETDEVIDKRKNGTFFNLHSTVYPLHVREERFYVQKVDDITNAKKVEAFRRNFVRIAAHDIRSPLQTLHLLSELAAASGKNAENDLDMRRELLRMENLTKMLLDVSQFELGKIVLNKKDFNLSDVIKSAAEGRHAHPGKVIFKDLHRTIARGDPDRVSQILMNLIENALKYSGSKVPVIISLSKKGRLAITSVSDKGKGIPKADIPKIFKAFFRTKAALHSSVRGSGLGLYIVREIIRAHKGRIWVESKEGKGTTFSFSLPLARESDKRKK